MKLFKSNQPYAKHMRSFGCRLFVQNNTPYLSKLSARLIEGVNLGHVNGGIYKFLTSEKVIATKHVKFVERDFPGMSLLKERRQFGRVITGDATHHCEHHSSDSSDDDSHSASDRVGNREDNITNASDEAFHHSMNDMRLTHLPRKPSNF